MFLFFVLKAILESILKLSIEIQDIFMFFICLVISSLLISVFVFV